MPSPLIKAEWPVCSLERAQELGLDVAKTSTCAPPPSISGNREIMGCPYWKPCRFDRAPYGTFKGKGPKIVGYALRTIEGNAKRDIIACFNFIGTLQPAMDEGIAMKMAGASRYVVVKIIAQEGEPIRLRRVVNAGLNKDGTAKWTQKIEEVSVPVFADPTEIDGFLEDELDIIDEMTASTESEVTMPQKSAGKPVAAPVAKAHG